MGSSQDGGIKNMEPIIRVKNLNKRFEEETSKNTFLAIKDINLEIASGEFFVALGPSGSGKSTLLRIINAFETPTTGEISLMPGIDFADFSFVFQQFALFPWLTVYQNIELGVLHRGLPEKERTKIVKEQLELMGLTKFDGSYPKELSGGMKQRVGIGRALAQNPKVIILDEPFSELDSFTSEELRQDILKIWAEKKLTIIMVTHLIEEALELADRIAIMTPRPGQIERIIKNDLPRPRDKRSKDFFKLYDEIYSVIKP